MRIVLRKYYRFIPAKGRYLHSLAIESNVFTFRFTDRPRLALRVCKVAVANRIAELCKLSGHAVKVEAFMDEDKVE